MKEKTLSRLVLISGAITWILGLAISTHFGTSFLFRLVFVSFAFVFFGLFAWWYFKFERPKDQKLAEHACRFGDKGMKLLDELREWGGYQDNKQVINVGLNLLRFCKESQEATGLEEVWIVLHTKDGRMRGWLAQRGKSENELIIPKDDDGPDETENLDTDQK